MSLSSGTTALTSSSDAAVTAIANTYKYNFERVRLSNGGAAGFVSWDGGTTKHHFAASAVSEFVLKPGGASNAILVYRIPSGMDLSALFVSAL